MSNADIHVYYDEALGQYRESFPVDGYVHERVEDRERKRTWAQREDARKRNTRYYVTSYHEPVSKLSAMLALNELGAVMKLLPYMRMDKAGDLYYEGERMGIAEMAKAIGKAARWTTELAGSLVKHGVLHVSKQGRRLVYAIDPEYHTIGRALTRGESYTKVYQTKTRTDIRDVSVQAAGLLYCMIPYVNYEWLYLCANPNEKDKHAVQPITQAMFARALGVDEQTIRRGLRELSRHGFIMRSEAFGSVVIKMNPDVMYRKKYDDDEYTQSVRYEFEQNAKGAAIDGAFEGLDKELPF